MKAWAFFVPVFQPFSPIDGPPDLYAMSKLGSQREQEAGAQKQHGAVKNRIENGKAKTR